MTNLLDKVNLLLTANVHDLVNQALRANSVAVLNEQIRRAGDNMDQLLDTIAQLTGDANIERRKNGELAHAIARLQQDAEANVRAGKDDLAALAIKSKQLKEAAKTKSDQSIASYDGDLTKLKQARDVLTMKVEELKTTRDNVENALRLAKTKGRTVRTLKDLTDVLKEDGAAGIQDWAERVQAKEDAALEIQMQKSGALLDPLADSSVSAELQRMKERMGTPTPA